MKTIHLTYVGFTTILFWMVAYLFIPVVYLRSIIYTGWGIANNIVGTFSSDATRTLEGREQ